MISTKNGTMAEVSNGLLRRNKYVPPDAGNYFVQLDFVKLRDDLLANFRDVFPGSRELGSAVNPIGNDFAVSFCVGTEEGKMGIPCIGVFVSNSRKKVSRVYSGYYSVARVNGFPTPVYHVTARRSLSPRRVSFDFAEMWSTIRELVALAQAQDRGTFNTISKACVITRPAFLTVLANQARWGLLASAAVVSGDKHLFPKMTKVGGFSEIKSASEAFQAASLTIDTSPGIKQLDRRLAMFNALAQATFR